MPKSFGSPTGLAIVIGLIVGIGILFMGFAIFYKFIVLGPEVRWNEASSEPIQRESQSNSIPHNPYRHNMVVPQSQAVGVPTADVEMGVVSSFRSNNTPKHEAQHTSTHGSGGHNRSHGHVTASTVVPVVEAVLYESDMETYLPNDPPPNQSSTVDINANDARAQAMRDWYDS